MVAKFKPECFSVRRTMLLSYSFDSAKFWPNLLTNDFLLSMSELKCFSAGSGSDYNHPRTFSLSLTEDCLLPLIERSIGIQPNDRNLFHISMGTQISLDGLVQLIKVYLSIFLRSSNNCTFVSFNFLAGFYGKNRKS